MVRPEAVLPRHCRGSNPYHSQPDSREQQRSPEEARPLRPEEAVTAVVEELVARGHRPRPVHPGADSALAAHRARQAHPAHLEVDSAEADSRLAQGAGQAEQVMHLAAWATCLSVRRSTSSPRTARARLHRR